MPLIEAVLTYRPSGLGDEGAVHLGATDQPHVLRAVRDALMEQARREAALWRDVDAGLTAMKAAEFERLARVFSILLPDDELKPELRVVKSDTERPASSKPPDGSLPVDD